MLKEIYEQPEAVAETIGDRLRHGRLVLEGLGLSDDELRKLRRVVILACGTAYHAGVVGRYVIEEWGRIPVEPDIASEWIYRNPVIGEDTLVIGISQSGETRDTVNAMKLARELGAHTLAITNMMGSQITREVDSVLYTRCGLEVGVAASKTFTAQVALFYLIAMKFAQVRETLPPDEIRFIVDAVYELPAQMEAFLDGDHPIEEIAQRFYDKPFFLYLGRHIGLPVALEGALKLKEISYIPTEAYSAGEMKHGPIALLDDRHAGRRRRDRPARLREDRLEHPGDAGARRARDRDRDRRQRGHPAPRRRRHLRPEVAELPPGGARVAAAAAAGLPDRAPARAERRPASQSGQNRYRRVTRRCSRHRRGHRHRARDLRAAASRDGWALGFATHERDDDSARVFERLRETGTRSVGSTATCPIPPCPNGWWPRRPMRSAGSTRSSTTRASRSPSLRSS